MRQRHTVNGTRCNRRTVCGHVGTDSHLHLVLNAALPALKAQQSGVFTIHMHGQAIDHSGGQPLLEVSQIRPHILHSNLVTEMSHYRTFVHILRVVLISQTSYCCVIQLVGNNYEFRIRVTQLKSGIHVGVSDAQTITVRLKPKNTVR